MKTEIINIRVSEPDKEELRAYAEMLGMSLSTYLIMRGLNLDKEAE